MNHIPTQPSAAHVETAGASSVAAGVLNGFPRPARQAPWQPPKRAIDLVAGAALLLLFGPLMLVIAAIIQVTDGKPVLIRHRRIGRDGRSFACLKFRSMVVNADAVLAGLLTSDPVAREEWATRRKLTNDPRITRIGSFLRKSSLDELPQLINVVRGEMSLVGPRPVVAAELEEHYTGSAADYYRAVRPGVTGLWQVSGRSDTSYAERVRLDVDYVRRASFGLDVSILLRTIGVVIGRRGAS